MSQAVRSAVIAILLVASFASAGVAQPRNAAAAAGQAATSDKNVFFDHLNDDGDRAYQRKVSNGEAFSIDIANTCPEVFSYEIRGILRSAGAPATKAGIMGNTKRPLETKTLPVVHDSRYGGYIVSIARTSEDNPCVDAEKLESRILIVSTPLIEWDLSFSGAFTISSLTNPQYSLQPHPTEAGSKQVREDKEAEDATNLGIAAFVHVYHHKLPWLAGTFGLGVREGNKTEYFLGGGVRFSDKATLNTGVVFGPIARLPNGVTVGDPVSDDNVLTNLPTRVARGFFVGISYSFVDVRNKLQQPFAGSSGAGSALPAESGSTESADRTVCAVTLDRSQVTLGSAQGATTTVRITGTTPCVWKVAGVPTWASVSADSGTGNQTLTITTRQANDGGVDRRLSIVVIGDKSLTLAQAKK